MQTIRATRYTTVEFQMLSEEIKDFYVLSLPQARMDSYEPPITEIILRLASSFSLEPWCFADVGANTGLYTLSVAACHPQAHCHAFEPAPSIADALLRNVTLNPQLRNRISINTFGLSSHARSAAFHETINDKGFISTSSSLHVPNEHSYSEYPVELQMLDDQHFAYTVRLLKIDVEGHELEVLQGGKRTIKIHRPVILFEVLEASSGSRFNQFAEELSYCFVGISGNTYSRTPTFSPAVQLNYILCPAEQFPSTEAILLDAGLSHI